MERILTMSDVINVSKNKKVLVSDLVHIKGEIFSLIKKGWQFDDEVLKEAHIRKIVREPKVRFVIVDHEQEKNKDKYLKETESLKNILKSLNTLDNQTEESFNNLEEYKEEEPIDNSYLEEDE